jgi:ABC-2 type transport system ATP-binding protein
MRQRLGIATALLGDPGVLLFDEPINGLDLDGVLWIRRLLRQLADDGRTVLVSSHLMSEMQQTADRLVVVGRGRLIADTTTEQLIRGLGARQVRVRSSQADALFVELRSRGMSVHRVDGDELHIADRTAEHLPLHHLSEIEQSLEDAYLGLTGSSVEYVGRQPELVGTAGGTAP